MNSYLIGCGFTKAIFPEAPLNNELLDALSTDKSDCAAKVLLKKYMTNDIEIALTKLDADIATSYYEDEKLFRELQDIRHKIEIDLGKYFSSYRATHELMDQAPWLTEFMKTALFDGDVAISLNYDCVFEGALDCVGRWSPKGGYGFFQNALIDDSAFEKSPITVLKIHGSTTFRISSYADKPHCKAVNFAFDEWFFPVSAKNTHFGYGLSGSETYLIAPSYVKAPTVEMSYCMLDALKAASDSQNLIVIGCGLRPEDSFLTLLLTHFLRQQDWQDRKIIIIDPFANKIALKVKDYWGVNIDKCILPIEGGKESSLIQLKAKIK